MQILWSNAKCCTLTRGPTRAKVLRWVWSVLAAGKGSAISAFMFLHLISATLRCFVYFNAVFQPLCSPVPLHNNAGLPLWCTWVEAAHPGLFRLFSIYSNITDNDPTYKTISTPARRMTWIKDPLRPIFTPIMYLWQVERVADRYSWHCYQFQQVLAEISCHIVRTFQTAEGRKSAGSELSTLAAFSPLQPVYAPQVISVFQQQEKE